MNQALRVGILFLLALLALLPAGASAASRAAPAHAHEGVASAGDSIAVGDVTERGAVIWFQSEAGRRRVEVGVAKDSSFRTVVARRSVEATYESGFTGQVEVSGLQPHTRYYFRAYPLGKKTGAKDRATAGNFRTAPPRDRPAYLRLLFGADIGGQGHGRIRPGTPLPYDGYHIFRAMAEENADLFLALGDMGYTDGTISARAPDAEFPQDNDWQIPKLASGHMKSLDDFRFDWMYHRADHHFRRFLATTPILAQMDDHELVDDGGGRELLDGPTPAELKFDARLGNGDVTRPPVFHNPALFRNGRRAFLEFNPIRRQADPVYAGEKRIYRSLRWGEHAEIFILDTRSYRDPKYRPDLAEAPKTMLGAAQKQWLKDGLAKSDATWKLIASSLPLSIASGNIRDPNGKNYRDGWANVETDNPYGYERELVEIVEHMRRAGVKNVVFLTGDRHWSTLLSYDPDGDGRPDFWEANIGALRAVRGNGEPIDPTLNPKVLFSDAKASTFAYGWLAIEQDTGRLTLEVRQVDGTPAKGARLVLDPR